MMEADEAWTIPDLAGIAALLVDENGRLIAWTEAVGQTLGVTPGMRLAELRLPTEPNAGIAARLEAAVDSCLASGQSTPVPIELPPDHPLGNTVMAVASPVSTTLCDRAVGIFLLPTKLPDRPSERETDEGEKRPPVDQIIAEVAHELSRPLASVLNYAELALQEPEVPEAARLRMEMVVRQAEVCRAAVHRFLEVGRPTRESIEAVDLNEVVRRAARSLDRDIAESGVGVALDLHSEPALVAGNPQDLEAVVRNLLENALHAAAQSGDTPQVRVQTEPAPRGVTITVSDNGPGIPASIGERVFEPFVTTKQPGKGTGLGLSISRRIVREHGGQIRVASGRGQGATFVIDLPVGDPEAGTPPMTEHPQEIAGTLAPHAERSGRALVVDDDASMRKLLAAYLNGLGYKTREAGDGQEALDECLAEPFDIIVCDVKMPGLSGAEFYRSLQGQSPEQASRVIFSTGILPIDENNAFLRSLPNPRLQKPFRLAALREAVGVVARAVNVPR